MVYTDNEDGDKNVLGGVAALRGAEWARNKPYILCRCRNKVAEDSRIHWRKLIESDLIVH